VGGCVNPVMDMVFDQSGTSFKDNLQFTKPFVKCKNVNRLLSTKSLFVNWRFQLTVVKSALNFENYLILSIWVILIVSSSRNLLQHNTPSSIADNISSVKVMNDLARSLGAYRVRVDKNKMQSIGMP
jgi:hypothetical protein